MGKELQLEMHAWQSDGVQTVCISAELGGGNSVRRTVFQTDLREEKISRR